MEKLRLVKIIFISLSLVILILIPLYKTAFNKNVIIKEWSLLNENDFQGLPIPFSGWGGVISSNVFVDYDSLTKEYRAYAGQNNIRSWLKTSSRGSAYVLNHEQYHFNVSEILARKMRRYLSKPRQRAEVEEKLLEVRKELNELQEIYDNETDHGLHRDKQRYWEYKIDSMLRSYETDSIYHLDLLSAGQFYFPFEPNAYRYKNEFDGVVREFSKKDYDMNMAMVSFSFPRMDLSAWQDGLRGFYLSDSLEIIEQKIDSALLYINRVRLYDSSTNEITNHKWIYRRPYLYKMITSYQKYDELDGFDWITESFFDSFEINDVTTEEYWKRKFSSTENSATVYQIQDFQRDDTVEEGCMVNHNIPALGFYRGPIHQDGSNFFVFDFALPDDSIKNVYLQYQKELIEFSADSIYQSVWVYDEEMKNLGDMRFGYVLSSDTLNECESFYYQFIGQ